MENIETRRTKALNKLERAKESGIHSSQMLNHLLKNYMSGEEALNAMTDIEDEFNIGYEVAYGHVEINMDMFMPVEEEIENMYYSLLKPDNGEAASVEELIKFFDLYADMEVFEGYLPNGGSLEGFCEYLIENN